MSQPPSPDTRVATAPASAPCPTQPTLARALRAPFGMGLSSEPRSSTVLRGRGGWPERVRWFDASLRRP